MKCKTRQEHTDGHFKKIKKWCEDNCISLATGKEFQYCPEENTIYYNKRYGDEKTIFTLLHECGHASIRKSGGYREKFRTQHKALNDGRVDGSLGWRVDVLREEFEAWRIGLELSKDMGMQLDEDEYDKHASGLLKMYCMWVANPKDYEEM